MQFEAGWLGIETKEFSSIQTMSNLTSKFCDFKCEDLLHYNNYLCLNYVSKGENSPHIHFSDASNWKRSRVDESDVNRRWRDGQQRISQALTPVDSKSHKFEGSHHGSQRPARARHSVRSTPHDTSLSVPLPTNSSTTSAVSAAFASSALNRNSSAGASSRAGEALPPPQGSESVADADADGGRYGDLDLLLAVLSGSPKRSPKRSPMAAQLPAPPLPPLDVEDNLSLMLKYTHVVGGGRG
jgi:hypothetical protein